MSFVCFARIWSFRVRGFAGAPWFLRCNRIMIFDCVRTRACWAAMLNMSSTFLPVLPSSKDINFSFPERRHSFHAILCLSILSDCIICPFLYGAIRYMLRLCLVKLPDHAIRCMPNFVIRFMLYCPFPFFLTVPFVPSCTVPFISSCGFSALQCQMICV